MIITLKDGTQREFEKGMTVYEIAKSISERLAKEAVGGKFNGKVVELNTKIEEDGKLEILTFDDEEGKKIYWHTSSHILAQAVKRLFKDVKLAIGPAIDNGFYYDFDTERPFTTEDFEAIEQEMNRIIKEDYKLERFVLPKDEAIKLMKEKDEPYKVELIEEIPEGEEISFYKQGEFTDLCAGPHLMSTGMVKTIKLLSVAGAYWKGDEKNKMLQRIYGISFPKKSM
jgi:threonyl-tRNA synthetase